VAIWVTRNGAFQFHSGLYHCDYGKPRILHFAWDRDLREDAPVDLINDYDHGLVALPLEDDDAQTLCALCRRVASRHAKNLRYRFKEWRPRFHVATGELIPPPPDEQHGFTCATFVLAMLRSAVVEELLAFEEWPLPEAHDRDERWQRKVAQLLCSKEGPPDEARNVIAGIGARRVLPTDVAGGAIHPRERWPIGFVDARKEGDRVAASLAQTTAIL
jgi:hypothetical protein